MNLQPETYHEISKLTGGTVALEAALLGLNEAEPLLSAMDGMLRYAKAYQKAYDSRVADDGVLGPHFLDVIKGLRGLLNGQGVVAMERDISTDSKDNGVIEGVFWAAMDAGGYKESDL